MVGQIAENFRLKDESGRSFDLYENLDTRVLLVFYPKDNSPVCTRQLSDYTVNKGKFSAYHIKVVGINPDSAEQHQKFCGKAGLDFPLLADENKSVSRKFDALNMFGGTRRKLVLIGTDKKILFEKNIFPLFYLNAGQIIEALKGFDLNR